MGNQKRFILDIEPVCVKIFRKDEDLEGSLGTKNFKGVSYCEAVRRASEGEKLIVGNSSIEVCKWSPFVLGLKEPSDAFSLSIRPRFEYPVRALMLAPLSSCDFTPDAIIVRAPIETIFAISKDLGEGSLQSRYRNDIGRTAIGLEGKSKAKVFAARLVNRALCFLRKVPGFTRFTHILFKSSWITSTFEKVTKNAFADMSVCRNSTVIPVLENAGNISLFCTGGITWGGNRPEYRTSGFPGRFFEALKDMVEIQRS